jgi:hypothetical protein
VGWLRRSPLGAPATIGPIVTAPDDDYYYYYDDDEFFSNFRFFSVTIHCYKDMYMKRNETLSKFT